MKKKDYLRKIQFKKNFKKLHKKKKVSLLYHKLDSTIYKIIGAEWKKNNNKNKFLSK